MTVSAAVLNPFNPTGGGPEDPGSPGPAPVLMTVTPGLAREWLDRNDGNRKLRYAFVAQLARDMAAGHWKVNGETIKIAADGTLLDGQHRLSACLMAGVPFDTLVVTGLPRDAQRTIDTGLKRRMQDQLAITGEKHPVNLASVARWALLWERGAKTRHAAGSNDPTHAEMTEWIDKEPLAREAAAYAASARADFRSISQSVMGMAWLLFTEIDREDAAGFLGRVRDGADVGAGHPAHTLRARIWRAKEIQERLTDPEVLALLVLAWNHYRAGTKITKLQLPGGGLTARNFPEPK